MQVVVVLYVSLRLVVNLHVLKCCNQTLSSQWAVTAVVHQHARRKFKK
jgi:hypothetical protein